MKIRINNGGHTVYFSVFVMCWLIYLYWIYNEPMANINRDYGTYTICVFSNQTCLHSYLVGLDA